jgi:hypothetical protein
MDGLLPNFCIDSGLNCDYSNVFLTHSVNCWYNIWR